MKKTMLAALLVTTAATPALAQGGVPERAQGNRRDTIVVTGPLDIRFGW